MPKPRLFISYKTGTDNSLTLTANVIRRLTEDEEYYVWMDTSKLVPGEDWNTQIYEAIAQSDIVLLLLAPETAASDWVRREVDVARGAQVFILPVHIAGSSTEIKPVLEKFDLPRRQYLTFQTGSATEERKLFEGIEANATKTRERQEEWLAALREGETAALFKQAHKPTTKTYATHTLRTRYVDCKLHIAAGDMTLMRDIDVLVNTENNYMQMARIFETNTLSSKLRTYGSYITRSGLIREDSVQQALYDQISSDEFQIPVGLGYVVPTRAGHPKSSLVRRGARYIFHVSTVHVSHTGRQNAITPLDNDGIAAAMVNCLDTVREVDLAQGIISPAGTAQYDLDVAETDDYQPIKSIIFPVMATGRGSRESEFGAVAQVMFETLFDYLANNSDAADLNLKAIHICGYSFADVEALQQALAVVLG